MMLEHVEEELLVYLHVAGNMRTFVRLDLLDRDNLAGVDAVVDIGLDVLEGETLGVFLAPIVEWRADGLGRLEAGDAMAAEAAEAVDGPLADVPLQVVLA
jgi:hypothetical protein